MAKIVEYFVVPQSPWTYLGHQRFTAIVNKHHAQVVLKPADTVSYTHLTLPTKRIV